MSITQSKSYLANLLSSESLIVEQRKVETAYFDLNKRLLVLPTFKEDLSNDLLDLFISHEIGHALYTPTQGWNDVKETEIKLSIVNVLEDVRIEKKVKEKYPGLKPIHHRAYNQLKSIDFFGLSKLDVENLNLIDKINLYSKIGFVEGIEFDEEEQQYLNKAEKTETFEEVVELAKEIQGVIKERLSEEEYLANMDFETGLSGSGLEFDVEIEPRTGFESELESENHNILTKEQIEDFIDKMTESLTQNSSEENVKNLYSDDYRETLYVDLKTEKFSDIVIGYDKIISNLKLQTPILCDVKKPLLSFKKEQSNVISYLVKEFILKKNAQGRKKAKVAKTGDLNYKKLHDYKISDDIFKRVTKVPGEKNHGMIFYLDWSGSMERILKDTIEQLMCLVLFCKKMNIPFEVYAFTNQYYNANRYYKETVNETELMGFNMMNLLSSRMNIHEFNFMSNCLLSIDTFYFRTELGYTADIPYWFQLGGTPLNHSLLMSKVVSDEFKKRTKVDILNNIFLTDGESHNVHFSYYKNQYKYSIRLSDNRFNVHLRDAKTGNCVKINKSYTWWDISETNSCVEFIKKESDYRYFGFRIISSRELKKKFENFFSPNENESRYFSELKKNNTVKAKNTKFDAFYLINDKSLKFENVELEEFDEGSTVTSISNKFIKSLNKRLNNKVFLQKFVEFIS